MIRYNHRYVMFAALFFIGCAPESTRQPVPHEPVGISETQRLEDRSAPDISDEIKILFLGDSLIAGFGLSPENALPEQIQNKLDQMKAPVQIINAGVSGDTSANGLARYEWSVTSNSPDVLILALGANDFLQNISPVTTQSNIETIIQKAANADIAVILLGLEPEVGTLKTDLSRRFSAIYPALAEQYSLPLYPSLLAEVSGKPDLLQQDGLHPTQEGVTLIAADVSEFLLKTMIDMDVLDARTFD